jgi:hypothetical protein
MRGDSFTPTALAGCVPSVGVTRLGNVGLVALLSRSLQERERRLPLQCERSPLPSWRDPRDDCFGFWRTHQVDPKRALDTWLQSDIDTMLIIEASCRAAALRSEGHREAVQRFAYKEPLRYRRPQA